jgi:hypothetical protein
MCQHLHYTGVMKPGIVTSGGSLERDVPTLALHGIKWESAGNYHLIDEESNRGRGFHRELPTHSLGFRPVRSKFAENPLISNNSKISSFKSYILTIPTLKTNLNTKTSLQLKINLIRPIRTFISIQLNKKG